MAKLTKRTVDNAAVGETDYIIWDDELPGFGLRVFASGKRSYLVQYRAAGRSRRYTIGMHGVWTPEAGRQSSFIVIASRSSLRSSEGRCRRPASPKSFPTS